MTTEYWIGGTLVLIALAALAVLVGSWYIGAIVPCGAYWSRPKD
jgi:hypothetical protein